MRNVWALFRRELTGYFVTPVAYVFIAFFLLLCGGLTFYLAGFYERGQAVLGPAFFDQHPILYIVLIPAISMRLWAEERKQGTIELLMTLPVTLGELVVSKFLAAWVFTGIALALTFPLWITVNYLGDPDNGVIAASYFGSWLMAGTYLALGAAVSALTKNQVIAFVISMILSFLMVLWGVPQVYEAVHSVARLAVVADFLRSLSMMARFSSIARGVIEMSDILYFASLAAMFLFVNAVVIELRKAA